MGCGSLERARALSLSLFFSLSLFSLFSPQNLQIRCCCVALVVVVVVAAAAAAAAVRN